MRARLAGPILVLGLAWGWSAGCGAPGSKEVASSSTPAPDHAASAEITPYDPQKPWPHVGERPPEIGADAWLSDAPTTLASLGGKVVVVEFCDLGSEPCVQDFARLRQLHERHAARGLVIITLAFADLDADARATVAKHGIGWQVGFGDHVIEIGEAYNYDQYPAAYVVGRDGKLRWSGLSNTNPSGLAAAVEAALAG